MEDVMSDQRWCFSWFAGKQPGAGTTRQALQTNAKWESSDVITVRFLEGDAKLRQRIRAVAEAWTAPGLANLRLRFVEDGEKADVRITFRQGAGSWSTIGTTCRQVPQNEPTMNFGWIDANSDEETLRSVVLHEFGHALGLIHEHQVPNGGIKWNRDAVIKDLSGPPNNWSVEEIEFNVLRPALTNETNFVAMDPKSIMMYSFPASWTLDGWHTEENTTLSTGDKEFIRKQYL
jgi:serralysin